MILRLHLFFFIFFTFPIYAQENSEAAALLKNAEEWLYSEPEQVVKIGEHIIRNVTNEYEAGLAALLLSKSYNTQGDYIQAVEYSQKANSSLQNIPNKQLYLQSLLHTADIYSQLGLIEIKNEYLSIANAIAKNHSKLQEQLDDYYSLTDSINSISFLQKNNFFEKELKYPYAQIDKGSLQTRLANNYLEHKQYDTALKHYTQALKNIRETPNNEYWEMVALISFSDYFFDKKEYQKAIDTLNKAIEAGAKFKNSHFLNSAYDKISAAYLALDNNEQYQKFSQMASVVANDIEIQKTRTTNLAFNYLQQEQNNSIVNAENYQRKQRILLMSLSGILLLIWLIVKWISSVKLNHEKDIISYLNLIYAPKIKDEIPKIEISKTLSIPKETEDIILAKMKKFEESNKFLNKEMSLGLLASQFDTNTKYLSEIINKHQNKNFNSYINDLRINYIVEKLKTTPNYLNYKVSYLAEEAGFASHSSFATIFKNNTGISPNVFIQLLIKDKKNNKNAEAA